MRCENTCFYFFSFLSAARGFIFPSACAYIYLKKQFYVRIRIETIPLFSRRMFQSEPTQKLFVNSLLKKKEKKETAHARTKKKYFTVACNEKNKQRNSRTILYNKVLIRWPFVDRNTWLTNGSDASAICLNKRIGVVHLHIFLQKKKKLNIRYIIFQVFFSSLLSDSFLHSFEFENIINKYVHQGNNLKSFNIAKEYFLFRFFSITVSIIIIMVLLRLIWHLNAKENPAMLWHWSNQRLSRL